MSKADTGLGKCNQELGKATNSQTLWEKQIHRIPHLAKQKGQWATEHSFRSSQWCCCACHVFGLMFWILLLGDVSTVYDICYIYKWICMCLMLDVYMYIMWIVYMQEICIWISGVESRLNLDAMWFATRVTTSICKPCVLQTMGSAWKFLLSINKFMSWSCLTETHWWLAILYWVLGLVKMVCGFAQTNLPMFVRNAARDLLLHIFVFWTAKNDWPMS